MKEGGRGGKGREQEDRRVGMGGGESWAHVPQAAGHHLRDTGDTAADRGPGKARRDQTRAHQLC